MLMDVASSENALTREDLLKELRRRMKSSMRVLNIRRPKYALIYTDIYLQQSQ